MTKLKQKKEEVKITGKHKRLQQQLEELRTDTGYWCAITIEVHLNNGNSDVQIFKAKADELKKSKLEALLNECAEKVILQFKKGSGKILPLLLCGMLKYENKKPLLLTKLRTGEGWQTIQPINSKQYE